MKTMKKALSFALLIAMVLSVAACGCVGGKIDEKVRESEVSGGEVFNQFLNLDLDASAAVIDNYHATSVQEVLNLWKQAHMQKNDMGIVNGNGALIYGICSPDLRGRCLEEIKVFGSWNFYYNAALGTSDQTLVPQAMTFGEPERLEEDDMIRYIVEVNEITNSGETQSYQMFVDFIDGGYYFAGRTSLNTEIAVEGMEATMGE